MPGAPQSVKLYYFDVPGRGEPIRLALRYRKVDFEDVRIPEDQWLNFKPKFPLGQVPCLEVDGVFIPETDAILHYVGQLCNLYPADPMEAAIVDAVCSVFNGDIQGWIAKWYYASADQKEDVRVQMVTVEIPRALSHLDQYLSKMSPGQFITKSLSVADIHLHYIVGALIHGNAPFLDTKKEFGSFGTDYATLFKIYRAINGIPFFKELPHRENCW